MKNACKRLFSLMLALVLLVSVVPFQASAMVEEGEHNIKVKFLDENGDLLEYALGYYEWQNEETPLWGDSAAEYLKATDISGYELPNLDAEPAMPTVNKQGIFVYEVQLIPAEDEIPAIPVEPATPVEPDPVTYVVAVYVDDACVDTLYIEEGKTVPADDLAKHAMEGYTLTWETNGAPFTPGETKVKNDMAIGAVYTLIDDGKDDKPTQYFVTFQYGNGEETTLTYDVNGNIVDGKAIPDAGENFKCWRDVETGKKFDPKEGPSKNMIVRAEYEKDDNNNNDNDEYADFIFYFETKRGTRVGEYKFYAQKNSVKDVSEKTAQEYLNAEQTLYSEFRGNKYEVTNVKGDEFKYDRQTGNYFCTVEVREVSNNGGNNGNHDEEFGKDNVRVTFLYDNTNKKVDYTFYQKNLNKGFELDDDDALWILKNKTRIDTDKYALPDEDDFEYYYNNGKMQVTIELVEKNRDNMTVKFYYDHERLATVTFKADRPSRDSLTTRIAKNLLEQADLDHKYQLKTDRRGNLEGVRYDEEDREFKVDLDKIRTEGRMDITVYVRNSSKDDYKKVIDDKTITVYSDETYEDDVFDWINRAERDDRHYSDYDYRIKDHDFDRDHKNLKVYLEKRYHEDDDRKIYLQVYINGDKTSYAKKLTITNSRYITDDGELDIDEAIKIVREYFVPKNSEKDMNFDGLWLQGKDDVFDYDDEHDTINLKKYRDRNETATVVIMANNARLKNNSTNPKTGDEILVAVTVMAVSATALAAAYVLNKKRMAK